VIRFATRHYCAADPGHVYLANQGVKYTVANPRRLGRKGQVEPYFLLEKFRLEGISREARGVVPTVSKIRR